MSKLIKTQGLILQELIKPIFNKLLLAQDNVLQYLQQKRTM